MSDGFEHFVLVAVITDYEDELISACTGNEVESARSSRISDAFPAVGDLVEHLIACGVPHSVVDALEVVDVDRNNGKWLIFLNKGLDELSAGESVWQTRQVVGYSLIPDPSLVLVDFPVVDVKGNNCNNGE